MITTVGIGRGVRLRVATVSVNLVHLVSLLEKKTERGGGGGGVKGE